MRTNRILKNIFVSFCLAGALFSVSCTASSGIAEINASSIEIIPLQGVYVSPGNTIKFKTKLLPQNVTNKEITWSSRNTNVATVNSDGVVTGVAVSEKPVEIVAQTVSGNIKKSVKVYVQENVVKLSKFTAECPVTEIEAGSARAVTLNFFPENASDKSLKWTSSNADCVYAEDGIIYAVSVPKDNEPVTITVYANGNAQSYSFDITVTPYKPSTNTTVPEFPSITELKENANFPSKRGICYNHLTQEQIEAVAAGNVTWSYNWGKATESQEAPFIGAGKLIAFMPMMWGNPNENAIRELKQYLTANPGTKYLLGINEPNMADQGGCNTTPESAARAWPMLEQVAEEFNLYLVSPAMTYSGSALTDGKVYSSPESWLDVFIAEYKKNNDGKFPRMDFIALHSYMAWPSSVVEGYCKKYADYYAEYNYFDKTSSASRKNNNNHEDVRDKPMKVLLTEFCAWWDEGAAIDFDWQCEKAAQKIEALDQSDFVEAYAWFKADGVNGERPWNSLYNGSTSGKLNKLGLIYTYLSNHNTEKYFTEGEGISAVNYITSSNFKSDSSDPYNSPLGYEANTDELSQNEVPLIISKLTKNQFINYQIETESEGLYEIRLRYWSSSDKKFTVNGQEILLPSTDKNWVFYKANISLPEGKQILELKSLDAKTCKLAWLDFQKQ